MTTDEADRDDEAAAAGGRRPRERSGSRRVWLHEVEVQVTALRGELRAVGGDARDGERQHERSGVVACVEDLLNAADAAACGVDPERHRLRTRWTGDCIEAAYRNVHRAEAEIAKLYDEAYVDAVAPEALARLRSCIPVHDPRYRSAARLDKLRGREKALVLSRAIQVGHEARDQEYAKVRRFRNIVDVAAALILVLVALVAVVVSIRPDAVPLCFHPQSRPGTRLCPVGTASSALDVWIVMLLGLLGGSLAGAVAIRNIRGTPTPYNLAAALARLKVPTGALTAVGGIVLLAGSAVPGFTALDSSEQILAYALVFGYAQQILTRLIDRRAGELASSLPTKAGAQIDNGEGERASHS